MDAANRITISGYYGFSNTGDEAVLSAIIAGLRYTMGDHVEITVLSADPDETKKIHGVRAVSRTSIPEVCKAIRECDLLISGGGSLIQDATSLRSLMYYLKIILLAKRYHRKVMVLGQGIGPLRRGVSRRMAKWALNGVDLITVRDADSAQLLHRIHVDQPPVHVTADPTFTLKPCPDEKTFALLAEAGIYEGEKIIAVSLRPWKESPHIRDAFVRGLRSAVRRIPARILLVGMQSPEDILFSRQIGQQVSGLAVQLRTWMPDEMMGIISKSQLVVGMRLHALIFAACIGVPFLGITYDPKVESFITAAHQESLTLREVSTGVLDERIVHTWARRDILSADLAKNVSFMHESAQENFRLAAQLLERC